MSRYTISQQPEVVVGWDDPLGTFFGQVFDDDGEALATREFKEIDELELWLLVVPNAPLPEDVKADLAVDRHEHKDWRPGELQRHLSDSATIRAIAERGYFGVFRCDPDESGGVA